jgi:hypothetical protein
MHVALALPFCHETCSGAVMRTIICAAVLACGAMGLSGNERVRLNVSPTYSFAPATLKVRVTVDRSDANRRLTIVAESGEFYRSSEIQLDGEASPATHFLDLRRIPGGEYRISAMVTDRSGRTVATHRDVTVLSMHTARP